MLKVFEDFDHCHDYEADQDNWCKNCSTEQQQACEDKANGA